MEAVGERSRSRTNGGLDEGQEMGTDTKESGRKTAYMTKVYAMEGKETGSGGGVRHVDNEGGEGGGGWS